MCGEENIVRNLYDRRTKDTLFDIHKMRHVEQMNDDSQQHIPSAILFDADYKSAIYMCDNSEMRGAPPVSNAFVEAPADGHDTVAAYPTERGPESGNATGSRWSQYRTGCVRAN